MSAFRLIAWSIPADCSVGVPWFVYSIHFAPYRFASASPASSTETMNGTAEEFGMLKIVLPAIPDRSKGLPSKVNSGSTLAAVIWLVAWETPAESSAESVEAVDVAEQAERTSTPLRAAARTAGRAKRVRVGAGDDIGR